MLVMGSSNTMILDFISLLKSEFAMTDLGLVTYFVGIEFMKTSKGLFSTQQRYIQELLEKIKWLIASPLEHQLLLRISPLNLLLIMRMSRATECWLDLFDI